MKKSFFSLALLLATSGAEAASRSDLPVSSSELNTNQNRENTFTGSVGLDSSSFLYTSDARGTQATTFKASLRGKSDTTYFHQEGEVALYSFVTQQPQVGFEAPELYASTHKGLLGNFTLSFGRKMQNWSQLDGTWRMMSLWSPRWTWDELHPQVVGMTGVFLNYETPRFKIVLYGSPIAIPERGTPVAEENGNIVSPNPFWKPLPSSLNVLGADTTIRYSLMMPSITQILLRPNFALKARYESEQGFFVSANTGVLPVHMVQMAAEPFVSTSGSSGLLEVNIRPQLPMRNINTLEAGYQDPKGRFNAWVSGSYEQPFRFENQATWLNPIITPSTVLSAGAKAQIRSNINIEGSVLVVNEEPFVRSSNLPNVNVDLPSRFPLKQGIQLGGNWQVSDHTGTDAAWIHDLMNGNHFASLGLQHTIPDPRLTLGVGMDLILAQNTQGWIGNYYGDDRIRGWLKYAF